MALPAAIVLLLAGGTFAAATLKKKGKKYKKREESDFPCDDFTEIKRDKVKAKRKKALGLIAGTNLAPKRVVDYKGNDIDVGQIQILWNSDGPWGRPGCEPPKYGLRTMQVALAPLSTKNIPIDVNTILGDPNPWGIEHYDDTLLLQTFSDELSGGDPKLRMPFPVISITSIGVEETGGFDDTPSKYIWPERRSWLEAQVESGGFVWKTSGFPLGWEDPRSGNVSAYASDINLRSDKDKDPWMHPSQIYGALNASWRRPNRIMRNGAGLPPGNMEIIGPDVLILLRPNEKTGQGVAVSFFGDEYVDSTLLYDPVNSDVVFAGKDWVTDVLVYAAWNDPEFLEIFSHTQAKADGKTPRPVDVLLWMIFSRINMDYRSGHIKHGLDVRQSSLIYMNMIGNRNWETWYSFYEAMPGFYEFMNTAIPKIEKTMSESGAQNIW